MDNYMEILERCQNHFASGVTRTYEWRVDQLDRLARMIAENEADLRRVWRPTSRPQSGTDLRDA